MGHATFPAYSDRCGWNALLPPRACRPAARGSVAAKYAIVGAGFTGLAAARRLAECDPGADIVVIEATTIGEGASGRNSGFLTPADIASSVDARDVETTVARNRYGTEGFNWLADLVTRYGIDCDLHQAGRIKAAATLRGEEEVRALLKVIQELNLPHEILTPERLRARLGTLYYRLGVFTEIGHLVQPAALIRGLADALPESVHLYEQSPVLAIQRRGKWHLETPDAQISADIVIMATNSAIKHFGYLRDRLVTIYTYAAITRPLNPGECAELGEMPSWGVLPSHRLGTTLRRVGADRFLVRSLYAYERGISPDFVRKELLDRFHRRYPELAAVDFDHVWGGVTALTMNGSPHWGEIDNHLYTSAGCNGSGIVKGTILGKKLAERLTGKNIETDLYATYGKASWIPPEPFRTIGFQIKSRLERRRAGLES